jgi:hypothetical protein
MNARRPIICPDGGADALKFTKDTGARTDSKGGMIRLTHNLRTRTAYNIIMNGNGQPAQR